MPRRRQVGRSGHGADLASGRGADLASGRGADLASGRGADLASGRAEVERVRDAIVRAAAALAAVDGLESLSVGGVAAAAGLSKSAVGAHFGSATELQLATVAESARVFADEVVQPALGAPPGLAQLTAACEAFLAHLERFPGGSFMASAGLEAGSRPGPVSELISRHQSEFGGLMRGFAATALAQGELDDSEDPGRLAFELNGIILAADTNFVSHDDPAVLTLARQIVRQRLRPQEPQEPQEPSEPQEPQEPSKPSEPQEPSELKFPRNP